MGILDPAKLAVIFVLALIVLGPERLPATAHRLGAVWRTLAQYREQAEREVRDAVTSLDLPKLPTIRPSQMMSDLFTGDPTRTPLGDERLSSEHDEGSTRQAGDPDESTVSDHIIDHLGATPTTNTIALDRQEAKPFVAVGDVSMN